MRPMRLVRVAVAAAAWLAGWGAARPALGNGAFPDSQAVITPAERPHEILLATNFGLITSTDDGRSWTWSCEQDPNGKRNLYQLEGRLTGFRAVTIWLREVSVARGETASVELTDRNEWFRGVIEEKALDAGH